MTSRYYPEWNRWYKFLKKRTQLVDPAADTVYNGIAYGLSGLLKEIFQGSLWQAPRIKVLAHHDAEEAAVQHPFWRYVKLFYEKSWGNL